MTLRSRPVPWPLVRLTCAVAATPEIRDVIVRIGTIPVDSPPPTELQKFLASEIDRWGSLIQRAGLAKTE